MSGHRTVHSRDGTAIAYDVTGNGPTLILVGGAFSFRRYKTWLELVELLAPRFQVVNYDRRGRGDSGDGAEYSVEREIEDLAALVEAAGGSADVFGMSSGAVLALRAAAAGVPFRRAVVYQPPFAVDTSGHLPPADFERRLDELVATGDRGATVGYFMREGMGAPRGLVGVLRLARPIWRNLETVSHTLPYDYAVMNGTVHGKPLAREPWASIATPTLVVDGGKSPASLRLAADALAARLPDGQRLTIPGQSHNLSMKLLAPVLERNTSLIVADEPDRRVLEAARGGDEDAFRALVEPHRGELHAHCYRMLGSLHDAEDALQETLLRAWRGLAGFDATRPLRPWLYRIATNASLDLAAKRPKRILRLDGSSASRPEDGPGRPLTESPWLEPYPDEHRGLADGRASPSARYELRESVELAFVAALQHLPARQRAVLILREVLGFSAREVAQSLDTTAASVNSALQRARRTVDEALPDRSQQATLRSVGDEGLRRLVQRYVEAWESRDVDRMVSVLAEDVTFAMPPFPHWWSGRESVIEFMVSTGRPPLRHLLTRASGQPAVAWYMRRAGVYRPSSIEVLALAGDRVREITAFASPELFPRFGLPTALDNVS